MEGPEKELFMNGTSKKIETRIQQLTQYMIQLVNSPQLSFDEQLRSKLSERHGIYRICDQSDVDITLRAGRTKKAKGGLRQRVYQNHLMGTQRGNLRQQLVDSGKCSSLESAKDYMKAHCFVQTLIIDDDEDRKWVEYFMLSVLRPTYTD
jgi:hypothetical protein